MNIDNIIISGARIYFPPDNQPPTPSSDILTFAVIRDADFIKDYLLLVHRGRGWELAPPYFTKYQHTQFLRQQKSHAIHSTLSSSDTMRSVDNHSILALLDDCQPAPIFSYAGRWYLAVFMCNYPHIHYQIM